MGAANTSIVFRSATIDFKSTAAATLVVPALTGKRFVPISLRILYTSMVAAATGPTITLGNNGSWDNLHTGSADIGIGTGASNSYVGPITLFVSGGRSSIDVGTTGISIKCTAGATGTTVSGVCLLEGIYI